MEFEEWLNDEVIRYAEEIKYIHLYLELHDVERRCLKIYLLRNNINFADWIRWNLNGVIEELKTAFALDKEMLQYLVKSCRPTQVDVGD